MPFTIGGQWVPNQPEPDKSEKKSSSKPVKVRLVKRGNNVVTVILNLNKPEKELTELLSSIKRKLGCGGTIKPEGLEIQGDKVEQVVKFLKDLGIKVL